MRKSEVILYVMAAMMLTACFGSRSASTSGRGGEVVGVGGGKAFNEPSPYGMTQVRRGYLKMGIDQQDSLWGKETPVKDISVDGFWMDETEVTNSEYKQFVYYVRDSILRERLADPAYGGDESYKITEDKNGDPVKPHLNWKKNLPRKPNEDEQRAFESLYVTNPVTGEKMLDASQLNYKYEIYDYTTAALRRNRLNPEERNLNTDLTVNPDEVVMISKDTAYIDDEGRIVRETINRPLSGPWDFLNTYIVNVYPDTTCWVNDFRNSDNEMYMRSYFSNPTYNEYPVVGVTWEQANAFCAWRTDYLLKGLGNEARYIQRYRLPTEAEWEYACRAGTSTDYYWGDEFGNEGAEHANGLDFKSAERFQWRLPPISGAADDDGYRVTAPVGEFGWNPWRLYDMSGNAAEWCYDWYDPKAYSDPEMAGPDPVKRAPVSVGFTRYRPFDAGTWTTETACRVIRGGDWGMEPKKLRSAYRFFMPPNESDTAVGFRPVLAREIR